jgi:hypothetical protein
MDENNRIHPIIHSLQVMYHSNYMLKILNYFEKCFDFFLVLVILESR